MTVKKAAPIRDEVIKKGMAYSPKRGLVAFTVPKFDEYMKRAMPKMPSLS
jgi:cysteinyl-tRNA synthetase